MQYFSSSSPIQFILTYADKHTHTHWHFKWHPLKYVVFYSLNLFPAWLDGCCGYIVVVKLAVKVYMCASLSLPIENILTIPYCWTVSLGETCQKQVDTMLWIQQQSPRKSHWTLLNKERGCWQRLLFVNTCIYIVPLLYLYACFSLSTRLSFKDNNKLN